MKHIDFHISYCCINKCIFCSSSDSLEKFRKYPLGCEDILRILQIKSKKFKSVNFTGGEPSLLKFLPLLVENAKSMGYKVYIGTNGIGFTDKEFCSKIAPFVDEICFSVHGHTRNLHNFQVKNKHGFNNLNMALANFLDKSTVLLRSNTVITRYNLLHLDKILTYLISKNIKQSLFSNLAPEGKGLKNYKDLIVHLEDIKVRIPGLVKLANKHNVSIRFFGLPVCILGEYVVHSNDVFWDARLNIEQVWEKGKLFLREEKAFFPNRGRIKTKKCNFCLYKKICGGVFKEYYNMFNDQELQPLKR